MRGHGHRWEFAETGALPPPSTRALMESLRVSETDARILCQRGFDSPERAKEFLERNLAGLHDPSLLPDIGAAVERIAAAIEKSERIVIFGDYDADGVTSTA